MNFPSGAVCRQEPLLGSEVEEVAMYTTVVPLLQYYKQYPLDDLPEEAVFTLDMYYVTV